MRRLFFLYIIGIVFLLLQACGNSHNEPIATAVALTGAVTVADGTNREYEEVQSDKQLMEGSIVKTGDSSRALVLFGEHDTMHLAENTAIKVIHSPKTSKHFSFFTIGLLFGQTYVSCRRSETVTCSLVTPHASVTARKARVTVEYYQNAGITIAKALTGEQVRIHSNSGSSRVISSCRKVLARKDGNLSRSVSLSDKDITTLESWIGTHVIDPLLAGTGCGRYEPSSINKSPVFVGEPITQTSLKASFSDKLTAIDPESSQVHYRILDAPQGMSIDSLSGVITFRPEEAGIFPVQVRAVDPQMNSVDLKYEITVTGVVTAILHMPPMSSPGDTFQLSASRSVNEQGNRKGLVYRFDTDGDGTWDTPSSGYFGSASSALAVLMNEGEKKLSLEVKSESGKTSRTTRTIRVNAPPLAVLECSPSAGTPGTRFNLDATHSSDPAGDLLQARWDLNGDGVWDYPDDGDYGSSLRLDHMWDNPGTYSVSVDVRDAFGLSDTAVYEVVLYDGIRITNIQMPDTIAVNDSFSISCITSGDSAVRPIEFAWNLDADTVYERKTTVHKLRHVYKKEGSYEVYCKVSDDKGGEAMKMRSIVVVNKKAVVDAGGPYKAFVNDTVAFAGTGSDPDNKIISYLWDFDNDGKPDHQSTKSKELNKVYTTAGTFTIAFGMLTDDSATVWDKSDVLIQNRSPKAYAGENIVSKAGKKVSLQGKGSDPDGNIALYRWDFDGDGTWDWESSQNGTTNHTYTHYSMAIFGVMDGDSMQSFDSVNIVICPKGMKTVEEQGFCIDTYEWPNKKGAIPRRNISWQEAEKLCESVGKRLCTGQEWQRACKAGRDKNAYPYGKHYEPLKCNTLGNKKVDNKAAKAGLFIDCVNRYDLHDMSGNVAEWTSDGTGAVRNVYGGWWQDDQQRASCDSYIPLESDKDYLYVGFRCCK